MTNKIPTQDYPADDHTTSCDMSLGFETLNIIQLAVHNKKPKKIGQKVKREQNMRDFSLDQTFPQSQVMGISAGTGKNPSYECKMPIATEIFSCCLYSQISYPEPCL